MKAVVMAARPRLTIPIIGVPCARSTPVKLVEGLIRAGWEALRGCG